MVHTVFLCCVHPFHDWLGEPYRHLQSQGHPKAEVEGFYWALKAAFNTASPRNANKKGDRSRHMFCWKGFQTVSEAASARDSRLVHKSVKTSQNKKRLPRAPEEPFLTVQIGGKMQFNVSKGKAMHVRARKSYVCIWLVGSKLVVTDQLVQNPKVLHCPLHIRSLPLRAAKHRSRLNGTQTQRGFLRTHS